jgi:hypothetical protein
MCETVTYVESYWTVCWKWIFPYPCKKYRTVTRWCCFFSWIKETGWASFPRWMVARTVNCTTGQRSPLIFLERTTITT